MADAKISALTGATTPVAGTEVLPIVQSGSTKKVSIDNLTKGRTVNASAFDTDVAAAGVTLSGTTLAADGTDANIDINITPKGTGEVNITKVDIDGGSIDGTPIGANSASTGAFSTSLEVQSNTAGGGISTYYDKAVYANLFGKLQHLGDSGGLRLVNVNNSLDRSFDFYSGTSEAGATKKFGVDNSGNFTVSLGNIVIGTAGKGIDFSATANSSGINTSELLDDYEEGTFTPTLVSGTGESITYAGQYGSYTKIGRQVYVIFQIRWTAFTAGSFGHLRLGGLPFTTNNLTGTEVAYQFGFGNPYDTTYGFTVTDITATQAVSSPSGTEVYIMRGGQSGTSTIYVRPSEVKTTGGSINMAFTYNTTT